MQSTATFLLLAGSLAAAAPGEANLKRLEYRQILMGVPVKILVYARDPAVANAAVHAAFDRIRQLNLIFSDYDDDSEISRLCRASGPGRPVRVSRELAEVLAYSLELSRRTGGAFDVSVGPLVDLWRKARRSKRLPNPQVLAAARNRVGYQSIRLDETARTVELLKPGMRLDFGGIVKGYAADAARDALQERGFGSALVALAGDISTGDPPPGQIGWRVEIQDFASGRASPGEWLSLRNRSVSTAGDAEQFVEIDGRRYSHLVDPATGLGLTRRIAATVVAPKGLVSDGLDSAACILGPEKGLEVLKSEEGACGRIVELTAQGRRTSQVDCFTKYLIPERAAVDPRK